MCKFTIDMVADRIYNAAMMELDRIEQEDEAIDQRADELFKAECNGKYTGAMIIEAISEADEQELENLYNGKVFDTGILFRQIVADYWSDYYRRQAEAEWETNKAEATRCFLREKYGW